MDVGITVGVDVAIVGTMVGVDVAVGAEMEHAANNRESVPVNRIRRFMISSSEIKGDHSRSPLFIYFTVTVKVTFCCGSTGSFEGG